MIPLTVVVIRQRDSHGLAAGPYWLGVDLVWMGSRPGCLVTRGVSHAASTLSPPTPHSPPRCIPLGRTGYILYSRT